MPKLLPSRNSFLFVAVIAMALVVVVIMNVGNVYGFSVEDQQQILGEATLEAYSPANQEFITPSVTNIQSKFETLNQTLGLRLDQQVELTDVRAIMLDRFFASKGSPLAGHGSTFIKYCDAYGAPHDCTTIPAIAFAESDYCRAPWSIEMHNCWGFGGAGKNRMHFANFDDAIKLITERLTQQYGNWFLQNPRKGVDTYCGENCPNWAGAVEFARHEINNFSINNGYGKLF